MSNKAVSNIRWEEFSDAELLDMAQQLTGEPNDHNSRFI